MANAGPTKKSARKGRLLKVLAAKHVAQKRSVVYEANSKDSPLLALPPEVRNRIWQLLLGGETIHIWALHDGEKGSIYHSICEAGVDDPTAIVAIKARGDTVAEISHGQRHADCARDYMWHLSDTARKPLSLAVLAVCRQIHQEAALIPYFENTFAFDRVSGIVPFLRTIVPAQAAAIQSIVLQAEWTERPTQGVASLAKKKLTGLKRVAASTEITSFWNKPLCDHFGSREAAFHRIEPLVVLEGLPIEQAVVGIYNFEPTRNGKVDKELADWWSGEVERRLMASAGGMGYVERLQKRKLEEREREMQRRRQRRADGRLRTVKE